MPSNKRKHEITDLLAGGFGGKKSKFVIKNPFVDRFGEVAVEIYDMNLGEICEKLFKEEAPLKFEIKNYKIELVGVSKTVCGETRFIEDLKANLLITYEKEKKDEMVEVLTSRFPQCTYSFK